MSASTMSISAANLGTCLRPVTVADKITASNLELLANDLAVTQAVLTSGTSDRKTTSTTGNDRDLSQYAIRGEAVLEGSSKEITPAGKRVAGGNSTCVPPRKTRKPLLKAESPWRLTLVSIFANDFVPPMFLAGLCLLIRCVAFNSGGEGVDSGLAGLSEFEGRISDVEGFLKKMTKMIQVQVDVVDKKIENEVTGLRKEMGEKIDEKGAFLEHQLKKLETKGEKLERYLSELIVEDLLSKQEFEKFVEGFRRVKGNGYEGDGLDEIREFAKGVIEKEIEKHAADGLGRVDYALGSAGASVARHSEPYNVGRGNWFLLSARNGVHTNADKMLKPSFGEPGQCFPLKGSSGFVQIRLRAEIIPEAVTLEHVAKSVAYDRSSAPKDCRIFGWLQKDVSSVIDTEKIFLMAEFTYDLEKSNAQTFNVLNSAGSTAIDTIRLDFTSNHGSDTHTCIYRLRVHGHEPESVSVHGHEPESVSMMAIQS